MPEDSEWVGDDIESQNWAYHPLSQPRISISTPFCNPVPPACSQSARTSNGKCYRLLAPPPTPSPVLPCIMASHANQNGGVGTWGPERAFHTTHKLRMAQTAPYPTDRQTDRSQTVINIAQKVVRTDYADCSLLLICSLHCNASPLIFSILFHSVFGCACYWWPYCA